MDSDPKSLNACGNMTEILRVSWIYLIILMFLHMTGVVFAIVNCIKIPIVGYSNTKVYFTVV